MGRPDSRNGLQQGRADNLAAVANMLKTPMYVSDRAMPPEDETIRSIEARLRVLDNGSEHTEETFVVANCGEDGLCTDKAFPPLASSLYPDPQQLPASASGTLGWQRVSGTLYLPSGRMPRLSAGSISPHPFLGALAAVACKQDLLLDLIVSDDHAAQGCFTLQFHKYGSWHHVSIDNFLPVDEHTGRIAFASSCNEGELWPSLLEKAYAKMHGSYYALEGGSLDDALVDLTGGISTKLKLQSKEVQHDVESGKLWNMLAEELTTGSVLVATSKSRVAAAAAADAAHANGVYGRGDGDDEAECRMQDAPKPPHGLLYDQCYTVLDAQVVGDLELVRLHCAWDSGLWSGPWRRGAPEWQHPAAASAAARLVATHDDEATFWMPFQVFAGFFTHLHVCSTFPATWHQLTLHCGWQGPSGGGPYLSRLGERDGQVVMGASSSWCCNPQFRVTVRKRCQLRVALGQQDPRLDARRHVRKASRQRAAGMQVLRLPLTALGRRWEVRPGELLMELPPIMSREAVASFSADPEHAYVLVPYASRAGDEGAFVLRTFSSSALEMEQLPSPLSLVLGGHWVGHLAGGGPDQATFGSNPQYMISCRHRTQVVLSVSRLDQRYAVVKAPYQMEHCVGLMLLQPEPTGPGSALGRVTAVRNSSQVCGRFGFDTMEEAVAHFVLEPETPYVVVPCLAGPAIEAPFELRILSGVPVELVPLPELKTLAVVGEWHEENAGGCDLHPLWKKNPRYLLVTKSPSKASITLSRTVKSKRPSSVEDMIGFYVVKCSSANGEIKGDLRRSIAHETAFVTESEVKADVDLKNTAGAHVIIPCTYAPGRLSKYTLAVTCSADFDLVEL
uniref:Calpain catalytic domain-containing protein n=1 Tax=Chlamydomonas euryale TaxID=1486919 RepID=A0A7R9V2F7_9CHLO|mmetsp:Transcript_11767/g.34776  ORF Transcript_11767/g.34776 Transcript_11767/m.34776 type:complete len:846 (+) Transcript_11767:88-2625(+)